MLIQITYNVIWIWVSSRTVIGLWTWPSDAMGLWMLTTRLVTSGKQNSVNIAQTVCSLVPVHNMWELIDLDSFTDLPESLIIHPVTFASSLSPSQKENNYYIVYKIQCHYCELKYIGETGKKMQHETEWTSERCQKCTTGIHLVKMKVIWIIFQQKCSDRSYRKG